jgi:histidine ammonia-lyase
MKEVILNGNDLTRQQVVDVSYNYAKIIIDTDNIKISLDFINKKVAENKVIYGVTTGFGSNADKLIQKEDTIELQLNLLRSHACGVGNNFSKEIVRAIMVIRLNTLLKGNSGVQESTVKQLEFLLNYNIHPLIPEQGSVGASGDLCPLSHMALPLIGEGEIEYNGIEYKTTDFLETDLAKAIKFNKITLSYKEGLALNNGTSVMAAVGTIALYKAEQLLKVSTLSSSLIFESLCARKDSFAYPKIHEARKHAGQSEIANWLTKLLNGSKLVNISQNEILQKLLELEEISPMREELNLVASQVEQIQIPSFLIDKLNFEGGKLKSEANKIKEQNESLSKELLNKGDKLLSIATMLNFAKKKWKPQDSYSIRCLPQVFGASKTAIDHVISIVNNELNAAVDNPLIFVEEDEEMSRVISGGNFHGQPIALVMDYLKLAVAEIGNIIERQINKMVDTNTSDCLPSFLIHGTGLNNGLMIPQYAAAAIVSENKVLVHPASADSIPTCENTEDHVSMGTIAARQALQITENVEKITSIAIMTGFYALTMRLEQFSELKMFDIESENPFEKYLAPATLEFYNAIKKSNKEFENIDFLKNDRFLSPEIKIINTKFDIFASIAERYINE